jgi:hypothetical protein
MVNCSEKGAKYPNWMRIKRGWLIFVVIFYSNCCPPRAGQFTNWRDAGLGSVFFRVIGTLSDVRLFGLPHATAL